MLLYCAHSLANQACAVPSLLQEEGSRLELLTFLPEHWLATQRRRDHNVLREQRWWKTLESQTLAHWHGQQSSYFPCTEETFTPAGRNQGSIASLTAHPRIVGTHPGEDADTCWAAQGKVGNVLGEVHAACVDGIEHKGSLTRL